MQESLINSHLVRPSSFKVAEPLQVKLRRWKTCLFTPLYSSSLIVVLLILGQQASSLWIALLSNQTNNKINQALTIQSAEENLLKTLTHNEEQVFITTAKQKRNSFEDDLHRLYLLLEDQPNHVRQLDKIKTIYDHIQSYWLNLSDVKKAPVDDLRTEIKILIELQEQLVIEYKNWLQQLDNINTSVNIFSALLILLAVGLHIRFLHQRVQLPINKLIEVGKILRDDHLDTQFSYAATDEISDLARVLNNMAKAANCRQQQTQARNQQLEDMILALSHDLRTPLIATRNTIDAMLKGAFGPVSSNWQELFEDYHQANEDLLKLIESLLDISRYESGQKSHIRSDRLCWERIFDKVISQAKANHQQKKLTYKYQIAPSLPTVYGDELEIQRVVQNLVENATRASEPNQEVFLEVKTFENNQIQVAVRDQGIGIAAKDQEKLFHRFIQGPGRRGRSGLGLYLCRQIITAHNGTISVESSLGKGSTFWFTLPVTSTQTSF